RSREFPEGRPRYWRTGLTKHRLMLSAATAALFAGALFGRAVADTDITTATKTALSTSTAGNITIESTGSVAVQAAGPAITINSNAGLNNAGIISNSDTSSALGVLIDTSGGNIVESGPGLLNL